ncbi:unnamed protein product [Calicophoron daubneyi]|uniref:Small ribosomal subunit protein uS10 domain-containing protein n=1 Tax=Calicophoron daubneyi TaxID=300641 RepID=A0AAV2TY22_CALDB
MFARLKNAFVLITICPPSSSVSPLRRFQYDIRVRNLDPPYLSARPPIPPYPELQFDIKCLDFVVLETFCKYFRRVISLLGLTTNGFPLPANRTTYKLYHPNSTKVRTEFELSSYHRVYRVQDMKAIHLPLLMDILCQNLPEGVELSVGQTDPNADEARYVPQLEVHALQAELSKLNTP